MDENIINSNEEDDPPSINNNIDENISISTQYIKKNLKNQKLKKHTIYYQLIKKSRQIR